MEEFEIKSMWSENEKKILTDEPTHLSLPTDTLNKWFDIHFVPNICTAGWSTKPTAHSYYFGVCITHLEENNNMKQIGMTMNGTWTGTGE